MRKIRIGFIGAGGIAQLHLRNLLQIPEAEIVAVTDIILEKAKNFASQCSGANVYEKWEKMYEKEDLDAVFICIPPFAHTTEVMEAAERGIHVFIEKPVALTKDLAWKMVEACEKAGIVTQVGYVWRYAYGIHRAHELVKNGELGRIGIFAARYIGAMLEVAKKHPWWRFREKSGGHVVEQVTHTYDSLRYIVGDVVEVHAYSIRYASLDISGWDVEDGHVAIMKLKNGGLATIYSTAVAPDWLQGWFISGSKGYVEILDPNTIVIREYGKDLVKESKNINPYLEEVRDFILAILEGRSTRTPIREGAKTLELTLAVRDSMDKNGEKIIIT